MDVANAVSLTTIPSFIAPLLFYVGTTDIFYLKLFAGLIIANGIVGALKPMFGRVGIYGRPAGAVGCDAFCIGGPVGGRPGFPSGHMTNVSMMVTALWWHTRSSLVLLYGIPWIIAMGWARWEKQCHNWQQILAGVCTGSFLGGLLYFL